MAAVIVPGLSLLVLGQAQAPAGQNGAPPLPAAGAPAAGGGAGRGGRQGGGGAGGGGGRGANAAPAAPAPKFPDGTPRLGAMPGELGIWNGGGGGNADVPYQKWAQAVSVYRRTNEFEPH